MVSSIALNYMVLCRKRSYRPIAARLWDFPNFTPLFQAFYNSNNLFATTYLSYNNSMLSNSLIELERYYIPILYPYEFTKELE